METKKLSRSDLRHRILAALKSEPAPSVTALAQRLDALRPSVSRSVAALEGAGFIIRQGRHVCLSETGQAELQRLDKELVVLTSKLTHRLNTLRTLSNV